MQKWHTSTAKRCSKVFMKVGGYSQEFHPFPFLFFHSVPAGKQIWSHLKGWDQFGGHCVTFLPCSQWGRNIDILQRARDQEKHTDLHCNCRELKNVTDWNQSFVGEQLFEFACSVGSQELGESFTCVLPANPQHRERELNLGLRSGKKT